VGASAAAPSPNASAGDDGGNQAVGSEAVQSEAAQNESVQDGPAESEPTAANETGPAASDDEPGRSWSDVANGRLSEAVQPEAEDSSAPAPRSASSDLWEGLESGESQAPALDAPAGESGEPGANQELMAAAGLVGGGLLLLTGGALVATVHRRRQVALAQRR
jgi:hypothetical protein